MKTPDSQRRSGWQGQDDKLVDRIAPIGPHGKFRPKVLLADRAYDSGRHRAELRGGEADPGGAGGGEAGPGGTSM